MRHVPATCDPKQADALSWALEMRAISTGEPARLVRTLTGAIQGCGGWVLSRGANDTGLINLLFEFERHTCIDMYSILIASGVDLSPSGHKRFTELCQCTRFGSEEIYGEIASIDLEIQTYSSERTRSSESSHSA
jgi:hypothetical protein